MHASRRPPRKPDQRRSGGDHGSVSCQPSIVCAPMVPITPWRGSSAEGPWRALIAHADSLDDGVSRLMMFPWRKLVGGHDDGPLKSIQCSSVLPSVAAHMPTNSPVVFVAFRRYHPIHTPTHRDQPLSIRGVVPFCFGSYFRTSRRSLPPGWRDRSAGFQASSRNRPGDPWNGRSRAHPLFEEATHGNNSGRSRHPFFVGGSPQRDANEREVRPSGGLRHGRDKKARSNIAITRIRPGVEGIIVWEAREG